MRPISVSRILPLPLAICLACVAAPASAGDLTCKLDYTLSGWSVFYKTATGTGTIRCDNGQTMAVKIKAKGGGLTLGKYKVDNGFGQFGSVDDIREVLGSYVTAEANAGVADDSVTAQAMTKGDVSLALSGTGEGWNLGVSLSKFEIKRR